MNPDDDVPVAICSDHAGFELKEFLCDWLTEKQIPFINFGTYSPDSCDYSDFAHPLAESLEEGECKTGIAICGSGQGMTITVNKHTGIRGALCWNPEIARLARQHNNANICCLPARFISREEAVQILEAFMNTGFDGGRHQIRIDKIPI
ncbi:MAG TPA: ribose 5-phosphate isomerase B [Bacteroidales bacterium]|jgi:ribose 5-phosphate isomerase B|nr:ribose 5-phosphate isomerase B [Bacteroidales bacterium]HNZ81355.1 ribose 5-phosphate isomerase B [Bacteroidales bacterium]HPB34918.1 ribose 5-phosphate isomerase B [Bacteroidales bacterium]HQP22602.1 ribose 5-phosphate isomerase B [Bacteroidales bacterium]